MLEKRDLCSVFKQKNSSYSCFDLKKEQESLLFFKRIEKIVCFRAKKKALTIVKASSGLLRCDYLNGAGLQVGAVADVVVLASLDGDSLGNLVLGPLVSYSTLPALVNVWALLSEL